MADNPPEEPKRGSNKRKIIFVVFLILVTAAALAIGITLNLTLKDDDDDDKNGTVPVNTARFLVNCHPDRDESKSRCEERGCIWVERDDTDKRPKCSFPEAYGYKMAGDPQEHPNGVKVMLSRIDTPRLYGMKPYVNLTVWVEFHTDNRLRIKIKPTGEDRFEIPEEAINITSPSHPPSNETRMYDVTFHTDPVFGLSVIRRSSNATIFNTSLPGLAFYPQLLQVSVLLQNSYVYGFGEHKHLSFRHDMNYRRWSIFTRDEAPVYDWNLYGAQPVYMNVEDDGKANLVFLKNSNALEVFLQPDPSMTFRSIGGVLDFYIFLGDSPGHAVSLYTEAVGRPVLPPYWALGYQLCRWGYTNISDMWMVINRTRAAQIPYDVQWADIDSMFKQYIFTYDRGEWGGMPDLVQNLHDHHQHFIIIVDPGVGANQTLIAEAKQNSGAGYNMYEDGEAADIFVKDANGDTLLGVVWPGLTVYPDFTNRSVVDWYEKYVRFYRENESIAVDALWIDMNEPSSFVAGSIHGCNRTNWDFPPYVPRILGAEPDGKMFDKTICMTSQQAWGKHYDVHSLYAHAMAMRTDEVLKRVFPGKRPWTMTRSNFAGTGHYATKWMGDNRSWWSQMHLSVIGIMEYSLFGFAFNGADICGFWEDTTYELCLRWHQLGAFYPFARNHNGKGPGETTDFMHQDPGAFDQRFIDIIKQPLMTRYRLLPYMYTQLYRAHLHGETMMRPLMFEFPSDLKARDVDRQFLLGSALLISPVLEENVTNVEAYFPRARWYEYNTGEEVTSVGQTNNLYTPLDKFNLHLRGGHVIPWQTPSLTTYESRKNAMGLIVALDEAWTAQGDLYLDDGESEVNETSHSRLVFKMEKAGELQIIANKTDYRPPNPLEFETLEIYGLRSLPRTVHVDGLLHPPNNIRYFNKVVQIFGLNMPVLENHNVTWSVY